MNSEELSRKQLGSMLKEAREYLGFSQEEVAQYLGIPRSAMSFIESGQRKLDALELKRLAELYKKPIAYFTGEADSPWSDRQIQHLARKVSDLSEDDFAELSKFAEYLQARKQSEEGK